MSMHAEQDTSAAVVRVVTQAIPPALAPALALASGSTRDPAKQSMLAPLESGASVATAPDRVS